LNEQLNEACTDKYTNNEVYPKSLFLKKKIKEKEQNQSLTKKKQNFEWKQAPIGWLKEMKFKPKSRNK
jgi:hypothetical protein